MNIQEIDKEYVASTYARFPITLTHGKGAHVWDDKGKEYIDLSTGIAVNTFGYSDDEWIEAVTAQLKALQHTSNLFYNEPSARLAKLLSEKTGAKKVFFSNSGAEANECAIKVARKYSADKKGSDYNVIITLKNSFHGRTLATLSATGQDVFHRDFLPLPEGFVYGEANNADSIRKLVSENKVSAIMFETVQGEGGVLPLERDFVSALVDISQKEDILLIVDEVQTGNGRSGALYNYMNYGFVPDIVTTAKGLGGGLPIGATLLFEKVENTLHFGDHGSTFGANPVACAGALSVVSRLTDSFLSEVREKSEYIFSTLKGKKGIKSVTGAGLMIGIELEEKSSADVIKECHDRGVLVIKAKDKIRLLPPLNIAKEDLEKALQILIDIVA